MPTNPHALKWTTIGLAGFVLVVAMFLRLQSLGTRPDQKEGKPIVEERPDKQGLLQHSSSLASCRTALQQVNEGLKRQSSMPWTSLPPAAREELRRLGLTDE